MIMLSEEELQYGSNPMIIGIIKNNRLCSIETNRKEAIEFTEEVNGNLIEYVRCIPESEFSKIDDTYEYKEKDILYLVMKKHRICRFFIDSDESEKFANDIKGRSIRYVNIEKTK